MFKGLFPEFFAKINQTKQLESERKQNFDRRIHQNKALVQSRSSRIEQQNQYKKRIDQSEYIEQITRISNRSYAPEMIKYKNVGKRIRKIYQLDHDRQSQENQFEDEEEIIILQEYILQNSKLQKYKLAKNIKIFDKFADKKVYLQNMKQLLNYQIIQDIKKRFQQKQNEDDQHQIKIKLAWIHIKEKELIIQKLKIQGFDDLDKYYLNQSLTNERSLIVLCRENIDNKIFKVQYLNQKGNCILGFVKKNRGAYYVSGISKNCRIDQMKYLINLNSIISFIRQTCALSVIEQSPLFLQILGNNEKLNTIQQIKNTQSKNMLSGSIFNQIKNKRNISQVSSIENIFTKKKGIYLIQGPPGTGKSQTIVNYISLEHQILNKHQIIMVCAQSNAAINHLANKILINGLIGSAKKPKLLRLGHLQDYDQALLTINLPHLCELKLFQKMYLNKKYPLYPKEYIKSTIELKKIKNELMQKIILSNNKEFQQYQKLLENKKQIINQINEINDLIQLNRKQYNKIQEQLLDSAQIVFTTLSTSGKNKYSQFYYQRVKCLIIDEAAQATEISTLIPLQTNVEKLILVGDHKQLQPTIKSENGDKTLYKRSLFERLVNAGKQPFMLDTQYRMLPELRQFAGETFYQNKLKDGIISQKPFSLSAMKKASLFFNICYGREQTQRSSFYNIFEANCVISLVKRIIIHDKKLTIGVIAPYKSQVKLIEELINQNFINNKSLKVSTVDAFQGQQMDVIVMTCVKASKDKTIGFVKDQKRLNVSITRAKFALFVFGHVSTLQKDQLWNKYIIHHEKRKSVIQIKNQQVFQNILIEHTPFLKRPIPILPIQQVKIRLKM